MNEPDIPGIHAPLRAYLELAEGYYSQDKLDVAMAVVEDAFKGQGWPAGPWNEFYNRLVCEKDARDASDLYKVDDKLSIELPREEPADMRRELAARALEARENVGKLLQVEYLRPVMITVFLPDAALDYIIGAHGYVGNKTDFDKICLPYDTLSSREETLDALIHEFTHVASYELARGSTARWLGEGLATYMCGDLSTRRAKSLIREGVEDGELLNIDHLEGVLDSRDLFKDDPKKVTAAYYLSGSFVAWWVQLRGLANVREALVYIGEGMSNDAAIGKAAGMSLRQMERQWRRFMLDGNWQLELSPSREQE